MKLSCRNVDRRLGLSCKKKDKKSENVTPPSSVVLCGRDVMGASLLVGKSALEFMNLITVEAWMKNLTAFLHRISISGGLGQSTAESQSLQFSVKLANFV